MSLQRFDRVKETTTTTGTGTVNLGGAITGFRTFVSCVTSGATVRYFIETPDSTEWEVGEGIFTDGTPDTLSRVTVYASSNAGSLVNFSAGTKNVALSLVAGDIMSHTKASSASAESFDLHEDTDNGTNKITIIAPSAVASDKTLTLPDETGTLISSISIQLLTGWIPVADSWAYASADAPTFTITVPSGAALLYSAGMKIKLTQTTVKYFIITAVADTVLTVYGGTDYTLVNAAISAISYSTQKAPLGFPLDPTKWTVEFLDTSDRAQASPSELTWYNPGSLGITIPIGCWNIETFFVARSYKASETQLRVEVALSTANNSVSDSTMHQMAEESTHPSAGDTRSGLYSLPRRTLLLAAKTLYYLIIRTSRTSVNDVTFRGSSKTTTIRAVCAYL